MKQLACGHVGLDCDCDCVIDAATEEDLMRKTIEHIWSSRHKTRRNDFRDESENQGKDPGILNCMIF
ncbi:MAG: DUF1059 domain-containing protein [Candidatus Nitrosopolaris sp.]